MVDSDYPDSHAFHDINNWCNRETVPVGYFGSANDVMYKFKEIFCAHATPARCEFAYDVVHFQAYKEINNWCVGPHGIDTKNVPSSCTSEINSTTLITMEEETTIPEVSE
jgi:hypothetical protein